jgi:hypothetical protein
MRCDARGSVSMPPSSTARVCHDDAPRITKYTNRSGLRYPGTGVSRLQEDATPEGPTVQVYLTYMNMHPPRTLP